MSIVRMQKAFIIGLDQQKEKLISNLMNFGALEFIDQTKNFNDDVWAKATKQDENQNQVSLYEEKINKGNLALDVLNKYGKIKQPFFGTRRGITEEAAKSILIEMSEREKQVEMILEYNQKIISITEKRNKLDQEVASLLPWESFDLPLEYTQTKTMDIDLGVLPMGTEMQELTKKLNDEIGTVLFKTVSADKDMYYTALISPKNKKDAVQAMVKQYGFSQVSFKGFEGTVSSNLIRIQGEKDVLGKELQEVVKEIAIKTSLKNNIEDYVDMLSIELGKEKIKTKLLKTRRTFFIEGWLPERSIKKAVEILNEAGCYYAFREPTEDEEVPVLLDNPSFFRPTEAITQMYSLPSYRGFDPTSIYSLFYIIFFGMMFSDAGYGILLTVGCFFALKKFELEGATYHMVKLFYYCGISTIFWGVLFGGWFGDLVTVFAATFLGKSMTIAPLWFNPLDDPMTLLIFSLIFGVIHLFVGMGIQAYMQIKAGQWIDAVFDEGFWYLTLLGLFAWLGGGILGISWMPTVGMWMTIVGAIGLLYAGGRGKRGFGKLTGGLANLYNITSWMSDILSYARLLALGLATGVIAQVVNTMGSLFGGGVAGFIFFVLVFIVGHAINFAINVLGAFIHSARLQYVEFFGKFYIDGGEPFEPFRQNTKYIRIEK